MYLVYCVARRAPGSSVLITAKSTVEISHQCRPIGCAVHVYTPYVVFESLKYNGRWNKWAKLNTSSYSYVGKTLNDSYTFKRVNDKALCILALFHVKHILLVFTGRYILAGNGITSDRVKRVNKLVTFPAKWLYTFCYFLGFNEQA